MDYFLLFGSFFYYILKLLGLLGRTNRWLFFLLYNILYTILANLDLLCRSSYRNLFLIFWLQANILRFLSLEHRRFINLLTSILALLLRWACNDILLNVCLNKWFLLNKRFCFKWLNFLLFLFLRLIKFWFLDQFFSTFCCHL